MVLRKHIAGYQAIESSYFLGFHQYHLDMSLEFYVKKIIAFKPKSAGVAHNSTDKSNKRAKLT